MDPVKYSNTFSYKTKRGATPESNSKFVSFLIKKGLAKDESHANKILIFIAVVFLGISLFLFFSNFRSNFVSEPPSEEYLEYLSSV